MRNEGRARKPPGVGGRDVVLTVVTEALTMSTWPVRPTWPSFRSSSASTS